MLHRNVDFTDGPDLPRSPLIRQLHEEVFLLLAVVATIDEVGGEVNDGVQPLGIPLERGPQRSRPPLDSTKHQQDDLVLVSERVGRSHGPFLELLVRALGVRRSSGVPWVLHE